MRVQGEIPGRTFLEEVHPVGAPNRTLILDTADICRKKKNLFFSRRLDRSAKQVLCM